MTWDEATLDRWLTNPSALVPGTTEYFNRFGKASDNKGYYSFDHAGVHFIALINVLQFKAGGLGTLGADQLAWVTADLRYGVSARSRC